MNFEMYRKKYEARPPRYAEKSWWNFRLNWYGWLPLPCIEYSSAKFGLKFEFFKNPRFSNLVIIKDDLQGDGQWLFIPSLFWIAFKIDLGIPDYYCYYRPRYENMINFNLLESLGFGRFISGKKVYPRKHEEKEETR